MQHSATKARAKGALAGFVAASLAASLMIPSLAFAEPTSAEKQAEAQSALASLNAMQDRLDQASDNYGTALLEQQEAEHNRDAAQARIEEANAQIADLQGHLGARARSMYRTGNSTLLDLLFGSTTFEAFATNWDLLNTLNQNDADLVPRCRSRKLCTPSKSASLPKRRTRRSASRTKPLQRYRPCRLLTIA